MSRILAPTARLVKPNSAHVAFPQQLTPTPAEQALADRFAWHADGGDPDLYLSIDAGWSESGPTLAEEFEDLGYRLGFEGVAATLDLSATPAAIEAFERGLLDGDSTLWTVDPDHAAHLIEQSMRHFPPTDFTAISTWHEAELAACGSQWR